MAPPRVFGDLEIVDAQCHLNQIARDWKTAPIERVVEIGIETMDAVGIDAVVVGEARGMAEDNKPLGERLSNGAMRCSFPFSELAVEMYPDRFVYYMHIDPIDPEIDRLTAEAAAKPGMKALRIVPLPETGEVDLLWRGGYDALFAAAERHQLPVFAWVPSRAAVLRQYAEKFPFLQLIVDHTGVGAAPLSGGRQLPPTTASSMTPRLEDRIAEFWQVCELASYPNVWLKWSHAPKVLSAQPYPYSDLVPLVRQAIEAYGADRIMWASDYTVSRVEDLNSWGQCLHYLLDSNQLSRTEKQSIFGGSVRRLLNWF
jgi:L-fuconolactonase